MKRKGVLFKYIKHDLRSGLWGQWVKFLAAAVIFSLICGKMAQGVLLSQLHGNNPLPDPSLGDYLFQLMYGMKVFHPGDTSFVVNVLWVLTQLFLAYIVSFYPFKDLHGYGQQMLIRSEKRDYWWLSKCVWALGCVTLYYAVIWLVAFAFALGSGNLSLIPTAEIQRSFTKAAVTGFGEGRMVFFGLALPWLASLAISMFQMTVSLFTQPIVGLIAVCTVLAASIFTGSMFAPGNYLMLMRWQLPVPWLWGALYLFGIVVVSAVVGYFGFKKRDIFSS